MMTPLEEQNSLDNEMKAAKIQKDIMAYNVGKMEARHQLLASKKSLSIAQAKIAELDELIAKKEAELAAI